MQYIMADDDEATTPRDPRATRARNLRTALVLLSIALVFFVGVIVNRMLAG